MSFDQIFQLSNLLVMPFWLLMILLPHWRWSCCIIASPWIVAPAALLYALLIVPALAGGALAELANPQLAGIAALLGTPQGATVGWVHFLAFDLFVGRWIYLDSRMQKISAWLASPVLFLVLMVGPLGLLAYLILRRFVGKATPADQPAA
jgi:hypothetical protein